MNTYVCVKSVGKRRTVLDKVRYDIPDGITTVRELITEIVRIEVEKYNSKETEAQVIPFLTIDEIETYDQVGKVSFGTIYSNKKADVNAAIKNALQCYEDGLVKVFLNEQELVDLNISINIKENDSITFVRLVFLTGSMW